MEEVWRKYEDDFNNMTDEEIEFERQCAQNLIDENESWTNAVAAWIADGRPRRQGDLK